jgi:hypothetical protein
MRELAIEQKKASPSWQVSIVVKPALNADYIPHNESSFPHHWKLYRQITLLIT